MTETSNFEGTPEALAKKLRNSESIQNIKHYDLFVSHSYNDIEKVYDVVFKANQAGLSCYVDWMADNDFLKRGLVSDYTKEVLKIRMEQSARLLYLSSERARASEWVAFELQHFQEYIKNEMLMIIIDGHDHHNYKSITLEELPLYFEDK